MAYPGQVIVNPITGEHLTFLTTAAHTHGALLRIDVTVAPQKARLPLHVHRLSSEHWEIVSGQLAAQIGAERLSLGPGAHVTVPAGVAHTWWNNGPQAVHFVTDVRPAGVMECAFETLAHWARTGRVLVICGRMIPKNMIAAALLLQSTQTYVAEPPIPGRVQAILYQAAAAAAKRIGYRPLCGQCPDACAPATWQTERF